MDPDAEAEQAASKIIQTSFLTVVFTACHSHSTQTTTISSNVHFSSPVTTNNKPITPVAVKKKKKKTIYLTFDDGPNKGTRKVMHIAATEQVPVTMFIIGKQVYDSREQSATYDSLLQCGYIEIENHSYSHAHLQYDKFYAEPDSAVKDFIRCADSLKLTEGIIRTPGRNIWRTAKIHSTDIKKSTATADSLQVDGFTAVGWDLEWHYNNQLQLENTDDELLQQVDSVFTHGKTKTPDHLVLLAHDQVYADAMDSSCLHSFIQKLKLADEYNFDVISNYPGLKD